jgi:hypothetical protein
MSSDGSDDGYSSYSTDSDSDSDSSSSSTDGEMHDIEGISSDNNSSSSSSSDNNTQRQQQQQQQADDISSSTIAIEYSDEDDEGVDGYKVTHIHYISFIMHTQCSHAIRNQYAVSMQRTVELVV